MRIATWNVNSVKAREERLIKWLETHQPDVVCLQELKLVDEKFPRDRVEALGYQVQTFGQKTYNGVAILSRFAIEDVHRGLDNDEQARLISAQIRGVRVLNAYMPNGQVVGSEKYAYKLDWLRRFRAYLDRTHRPDEALVLVGDFNVAPDDLDVANPANWADSVLCHGDARQAVEEIRRFGLNDVFRKHNPDGRVYSWWDYRMLAFPKNDGLRIDHIFATDALHAVSLSAAVDRNERKGKQPSDHAPVIAEFRD